MWTFSSLPCVLCLLCSWISAGQTIKLCSVPLFAVAPEEQFQTHPFFGPVPMQTVSWFGWSWWAELKPHYLAKKEVSIIISSYCNWIWIFHANYWTRWTLNWGLSPSVWSTSAVLYGPGHALFCAWWEVLEVPQSSEHSPFPTEFMLEMLWPCLCERTASLPEAVVWLHVSAVLILLLTMSHLPLF